MQIPAKEDSRVERQNQNIYPSKQALLSTSCLKMQWLFSCIAATLIRICCSFGFPKPHIGISQWTKRSHSMCLMWS